MRGAALGRHSYHAEDTEAFTGRIHVRKVRMYGDYDENGTYWGYVPGTAIYWYRSDDGQVDACTRQFSRADARLYVLEIYPNAKVRK